MKYTWIPEGVGVDRVLDEWAGGQEGPQCVQLCGQLQSVDLKAAPGKSVLTLKGALYLCQGTYIRNGKSKTLMGTVSCIENGQPRVLAGSMNRLVSAGVHAYVVSVAQAEHDDSTHSGRATVPEGLPVVTLEEEGEEEPTLIPDDSINDRVLVHSTTEMPKLASMTGLAGGGGWGAAVAASAEGPAAEGDTGAPAPQKPRTTNEEPTLRPGDILLHPRFGRCRVARGPMFGKVKVRRPTGALIDLHMKVLVFTRNPDEGDARVYALKIGRK